MRKEKQKVFRILRFFSITSLISILAASLSLSWFYHQAAVSGIIDFGERSNLMLSQSLLNAIQPELSAYLADERAHHDHPLPKHMGQAIQHLMVNTSVKQVDILDDEGIIVFSTNSAQTGTEMRQVAGFIAAIEGTVVSRLSPHNHLNLFLKQNNDSPRINSYIPVRTSQTRPVEGVFAVKTDVRPLMAEIEQTKFKVFFGSLGIMMLLYLVLLALVRHAARIIKGQETKLRERSQALELLSSQLITVQEDEKKRIAGELHEGVAQTLSSVKLRLEHAHGLLKEHEAISGLSLDQLVPLVQGAIKEVRTMAMEMRPPSLDELGVLATLEWYSRELAAVNPRLKLQREVALEEDEIPKPIKVVLYRSLQQILQRLAHSETAIRVKVKLDKTAEAIWVEVMDDLAASSLDQRLQEGRRQHLLTLREFIALSGGDMDISEVNGWGGTTLRAEWPL